MGAFCRPPDSGGEVLGQLHGSLSGIDVGEDQGVWLAGDFDLSHIDWEGQTAMQGCPRPGLCRRLLGIVNGVGLGQVVGGPARGSDILDLFLTSNPSLVDGVRVVPGMSDHGGIPLVTIDARPRLNGSKPRRVFLYHGAGWSAIRGDLAEVSRDFHDMPCGVVAVDGLWCGRG